MSAIIKLPTVRTVGENNTEILAAIMRLHCPTGFDADLTYGNGAFWKTIPRPRLCFDITPMADHVVAADSRHLPVEAGSLGNVVFDPPFLTYVKNGRAHKDGAVSLSARFGGYYTYAELEEHYHDTLSECSRVMRKGGKLVFKCQDIVHNHRLHCTHAFVIQWAELEGFRLLDLFVLTAKHRMPGPQKGRQRHARIFHSFFLVFEKR